MRSRFALVVPWLVVVVLALLALAAPAPAAASIDDGPGGPILVITGSSDQFGKYYAEILRNEGLNEFDVVPLSSVTPTMLSDHAVAILGDTPVSGAQATMFSDWVNADGNLIAMHPDAQLAGLLGLTSAGGTLANGYIKVDTSSSPGAGITADTMQFHGTADRYTLSGATAVASLYSDATTATANPAVTLNDVSGQGGQAAAFTYDLARSVVYTRQGNPAWVNDERDGPPDNVLRSDDLFFGAKTGDVQPDWVNLNKVAIPQADEQQRLLTNLIAKMNADVFPLPRFWYFPRDQKAVVVMTGDDHGNGGTVGRFNQYNALSPSGCSVADWECVRGTSYVYPNTPGLTAAQANAFNAQGFEIGLHPSTDTGSGCANYTQSGLTTIFDNQLADWAAPAHYQDLPSPVTNRTHCIAWSGWVTQARVELAHGMRLDTNYYYWPGTWVQDRPGMFTGSGMPMRFADLDGSMVDVYQAATQMTDESDQSYGPTINALLSKAQGPEGYYGAFTVNMHTDNVSHPGSDAIVAAAQARGVPVVSARQMLTWLDGRNNSSFGSIEFSNHKLTFTIDHAAGANGLRAMVPTTSAAGALTGIKRDGNPVTYTTETIKGIDYAFVDAAAGAYEASYAPEPSGLTDTTTTEFGGGSGDGNTYFSDVAGGELTLNPAVGTEFDGVGLPADWTSHTWESENGGAGGSVAASGGSLIVDGAFAGTNATYTPFHSLEFQATFGAQEFQHVGFGVDLNNVGAWAMFSTAGTTNQLFARSNFGSGSIDTPLPGTLIGLPHRYRIDWSGTGIAYYIDGVLVATHNGSNATAMRPVISDFHAGGPQLTVDWLHMSPYAASGVFTSRVLDAGSAVDWDKLFWTADTPAGPGVTLSVRTGDTAVPDGSWSAFAPIAASGDPVSGHTRYAQYRAELSSSDPAITPVLSDVKITYGDTTPPETQIDSGPGATTNNTSPQFTFSSPEPGTTFECRVDSASFAPCSSPTVVGPLPDGSHIFEVRATDAANNTDQTPASRAFTVDTIAPVVTVSHVSYPSGWNGASPVTLTINVNETGSGVDASQPVCTDNGSPLSGTSVSGDGIHHISCVATDHAGNTSAPATDTVRIDTIAPALSVTHTANGAGWNNASVNLVINASDGGSGVDGQPVCTDNGSPLPGSTVSGDGVHAIHCTVSDVVGHETEADDTVRIDSGLPAIAIDAASKPADPTTNTSASFTFTRTDPSPSSGLQATVCRLDGNVVACTSNTSKSLSGLAAGTHTFRVDVLDIAGNAAVGDAYTWHVNSSGAAPVITINWPKDGGRYSLDNPIRADWSCTAANGIADQGSNPVDNHELLPVPSHQQSNISFTVHCEDNDGNLVTKTVHYSMETFAQIVRDDDPLAYYRLGEEPGNDFVYDWSGNEHHGEAKNDTGWEQYGVSGDGDSARRFFGEGGYVYANGISAPQFGLTLGGWVLPDDVDDADLLDHGFDAGIYLRDGHLNFRMMGKTITDPAPITAGQWYFVAGTWNGGRMTLWKAVGFPADDGSDLPIAVATGTQSKRPSGTSTFYIGYGQDAPWLRGAMDEVFYFGSVLSTQHLYELWLADPPARPKAAAAAGEPAAADPAPANSAPAESASAPAASTPTVKVQSKPASSKAKAKARAKAKAKARARAKAKARARAKAKARAKARAKAKAKARARAKARQHASRR